jgi:hypothetical protein
LELARELEDGNPPESYCHHAGLQVRLALQSAIKHAESRFDSAMRILVDCIDDASSELSIAATHQAQLEPLEPTIRRHRSLKTLKEEMMKAHPDKGGSTEAFIKARRCYEQAKRGE